MELNYLRTLNSKISKIPITILTKPAKTKLKVTLTLSTRILHLTSQLLLLNLSIII